jgi:hypothetical protein
MQRQTALVLVLAAACASSPSSEPLGEVSAAATASANSDVATIDIFATHAGAQVYYSGKLAATPENPGDPTSRRTVQVDFALPAGDYLVGGNAYDAGGGLLGSALAKQVTIVAGSTNAVHLVIDLSSGATNANAGTVSLTATTDFTPVLSVTWPAGAALTTGGDVLLGYSATDPDGGDTQTFFTVVVDGDLVVTADHRFGVEGASFDVHPNSATVFHLIAGVVDSKGRADMWKLHGDPASGALALDEEVQGYALDVGDLGHFRRADRAGAGLTALFLVDSASGDLTVMIDSGSVDMASPAVPAADVKTYAGSAIGFLDLDASGAILELGIADRTSHAVTSEQDIVLDPSTGTASWGGTH